MVDYKELDGGMKNYFESLKDFKPLSKEEERKLLMDYKLHNDIKARNRVIEANLKYTCSIVKNYCNQGLTFGELLSEANDGLLEAIERYDPEKDTKLICYSKLWTKQRMKEALEKQKNIIHINDKPSERDESAEDCVADDDEIYEMYDNEEELEQENIKKVIHDILDTLTDREKEIFMLLYGIDGQPPMTMSDVSKKYKLSKERIRQIHKKGMKKLRSELMMVGYQPYN